MPKTRAKAVKGLREVLFPTIRSEKKLINKLNALGLGYVHINERGVSLTSYIDTSSPYGKIRTYPQEELRYLREIGKLESQIFPDLNSLLELWAPILYTYSQKTLEITFKPKGPYSRAKKVGWYERGLRLESYADVINHFDIKFERVFLFGPKCIHVMASCVYRGVNLIEVKIVKFSECNYDTILIHLIEKISKEIQELM